MTGVIKNPDTDLMTNRSSRSQSGLSSLPGSSIEVMTVGFEMPLSHTSTLTASCGLSLSTR